ncbi:hypothetical protein [Sporosarcina sp. D27]|uniref:hypothetical protein n=1 Tax=Sporosarcina sp. D27 TaxID=1382305 RepID=UPI0004AE0221|nr:hypothetical protein [Sporosarcina sp. D27]
MVRIYEEETYVELRDGRKGLIVFVWVEEYTHYAIELANGKLTTVYHEEIATPVESLTT